jgi:hypothetical protein
MQGKVFKVRREGTKEKVSENLAWLAPFHKCKFLKTRYLN